MMKVERRVKLHVKIFTDDRHSVNRTKPSAPPLKCVCVWWGYRWRLVRIVSKDCNVSKKVEGGKARRKGRARGRMIGGRWLSSFIPNDPKSRGEEGRKREMSFCVISEVRGCDAAGWVGMFKVWKWRGVWGFGAKKRKKNEMERWKEKEISEIAPRETEINEKDGR